MGYGLVSWVRSTRKKRVMQRSALPFFYLFASLNIYIDTNDANRENTNSISA